MTRSAPPLPVPEPLTPRPYQERDIKRMLKEKTRGALNASVTGAGKTLVGVEVIRRAQIQEGTEHTEQVLIIGPLNTQDHWHRTVASQLAGVRLKFVGAPSTTPPYLQPELHRHELEQGEPGWYMIGWEYFHMLMKESPSPLRHVRHVIFDEIHRAQSRVLWQPRRRDPQTGALRPRQRTLSNVAHQIAKQAAQQDGYRLGFSATPFGSKPEGGWNIGRILWPTGRYKRVFGSFWRWAERHLEQTTEFLNVKGRIEEVRVLGSELQPGSIIREFPCYIRHEAHSKCCKFHPKGIKDDLPPRVLHQVPVELTATQRSLYDQLNQNMLAWIDEHDWPIDSDGWPMVNSMRMHQVCLAVPTTELKTLIKQGAPDEQIVRVTYPLDAKSSKIDALLDILRDHEGERFLIFTHSQGIIPVLVDRIRKMLVKKDRYKMWGPALVEPWDGTVSMRDRAEIKANFLDGRTEIIVAQVDAIGTGTDGFQAVCSNEIWLSPSNKLVSNIQAIGRLNRDGQRNPVNVWIIYATLTLELDQLLRLDRAARVMDATLNPAHLKLRSPRPSPRTNANGTNGNRPSLQRVK